MRISRSACVFHEITKHSYTFVRTVPHHLDWNNRPMAYKIYPSAGALALPRDLRFPQRSTTKPDSKTTLTCPLFIEIPPKWRAAFQKRFKG
jgi:hypothetical protein